MPAEPSRNFIRAAIANWRERHQHPVNVALHLVGIPMTVVGIIVLLWLPWDQWYWGVGLFVFGYFLQWLGHFPEGNDMGEWAGVKRLLGLPYNAASPIWLKKQEIANSKPSGPVA